MAGMEWTLGPKRVVLADDQTLVLEAFSQLLSSEVDVVGTATDGHELIRQVQKLKPDIVVTEISMPKLNGFDACAKLLKILPETKIIFLTINDDPDLVAEVMRSGAKGYVLKSSHSSELLEAIRAVAAGGTYISPLVARGMVDSLVTGGKHDLYEKLTVRQREILQLLAKGKTMKETARILSITPRTVAFHKYRIMDSLGVENNVDLFKFAMKSALLDT